MIIYLKENRVKNNKRYNSLQLNNSNYNFFMYPYPYYPQQMYQPPPQSEFNLIHERPIQNSFEQIFMKLPNLICKNVFEDNKLHKSFKSNLTNLKKSTEQLALDQSKYNTKFKKNKKALDSYFNKQNKVLSLISQLESNVKNQTTHSYLMQSNHQYYDSNLLMNQPLKVFDDLLNTFNQIKILLLDNIHLIHKDLAALISSENIECNMLNETMNEQFNALLYEISNLAPNESQSLISKSIEGIYTKLNNIQCLLVAIPQSEKGNYLNNYNAEASLSIKENKEDVINMPTNDNSNTSTKYDFAFKISQNRLRKKKLSEKYY